MQKYDVIIIGGGVSGLSCAITLGSAEPKIKDLADKTILVIDAGASHLKKAQLYNVPGIKVGTKGFELLESLAKQALGYDNVFVETKTALSVEGTKGNFTVKTSDEESLAAEIVIFANGMQSIEVEGIGASVVPHVRAPRPGMVMIENTNGIIDEGKYVTGCAAGAASMYATAAGYGVQTATDILSDWMGKYTVIHDVLKKD